ncbi:MAG: hypothetical protein ACLT8E_06535 [Akkermansia sp.]
MADRYESLAALQKEMELWADSRLVLPDAGATAAAGVSLDWNAPAALKSPRPWFLAGGFPRLPEQGWSVRTALT